MSESLAEKLSQKKKVMSWKEKIGQPSKEVDSVTPSRKRPRSDEVEQHL